MANICSFEVSAQPIAPVQNVPYYIQGTFVQITNIDQQQTNINVAYIPASPAFVQNLGAITLSANYIDAGGALAFEPNFLSNGNRFTARPIARGGTLIFGVQYIIQPPAPAAPQRMATWLMTQSTGALTSTAPATLKLAAPPTDTLASRGIVSITADEPTRFVFTATVRQLFLTFDSTGLLVETDPGSYSLPIVGGPDQIVGP